ncbi:MAG: peptide deformylase [Patescibacteria group bacterium]|jgi:peptide deformylase
MSEIFSIVTYNEPSIHERSVEVDEKEVTTPKFQNYLDKINKTFESLAGTAAGLASPQCGINKRVILVQLSKDRLFMINPEITKTSDAMQETEEGCFSVPGVYGMVTRAKRITVKFTDRHGRRNEIDLKNFYADLVQHEVDHLDGILFVEKVTKITQGKWPK